MNLNNTMRDELAIDLAVQAMAKHSAGLRRLAALIADGFRRHHVGLLEKAAPEVPIERWAELIQTRVVNAANSGDCYVKCTEADGTPGRNRITGYTLVEFGPYGSKAADKRQDCFKAMLRGLQCKHAGFRDALQLFCTHQISKKAACRLALHLGTAPDLPHVPGRKTLDPAQPDQALLLKNANALIARLSKILSQGFEYLEEVQLLLAGIRTDKQLQELFPEAVKLLPPPPAPRSNIVPVELAQRVRKMLVDGVPED